jgi:AraC-like DNA-binding protein
VYKAQYQRPVGATLEVCTLTHSGQLPPPWLAPGYVVNLVLGGVADLWSRGATHRVGPGHMVLASPGQIRAVRRRCTPTATTRSVTLEERYFHEALRERTGASAAAFDASTSTSHTLRDALGELYENLGEGRRLAVDEAVEGLLDAVGGTVEQGRRWPAHPGVRRAREYLEAHAAEDVGLGTLTSLTGLSRAHLIREFRRTVGVPPHQYVLHVRVRRARTLLTAGRTAAEAASELGFYDQAHFARHVRRLVGVSAADYKRLAVAR